MENIFSAETLDKIETILNDTFISAQVKCVFLIDLAGNVISSAAREDSRDDIAPLAALAAGNFCAINEMAKIIGEDEFTVLFHKGERSHLYFSKLKDDYLLAAAFDDAVPLGSIRLIMGQAVIHIQELIHEQRNGGNEHAAGQ